VEKKKKTCELKVIVRKCFFFFFSKKTIVELKLNMQMKPRSWSQLVTTTSKFDIYDLKLKMHGMEVKIVPSGWGKKVLC